MLFLLVKRDVKIRYAGSVLGYVWTVLEPLLMSFVYFIVFTKIFTRGNPSFTDPFMVFLVSGQLSWFWFSGVVNGSTKSLLSQAQMVRSSNVPREIWVLTTVLSKATEFVFSLPVLAVFVIAYMKPVNKWIVLWPAAILTEAILLTGLALILAAVNVLVRDIGQIVGVVVRALYFASPVLYSVNEPRIHQYRHVFDVNPLAGILDMMRVGLFPKEMDVIRMSTSVVASLAVLALGVFVFSRLERQVLKEI